LTTKVDEAVESRLFGPLADLLDRLIPGGSLFFLAMDPVSTSVRFYRTGRSLEPGVSDQQMDATVAGYTSTKAFLHTHESLCDQINNILTTGAPTAIANRLYAWALHRLDTQTLVLGGGKTGRARLRFQDALEFAASGLDAVKNDDDSTHDYRQLSEGTVLCVPCYVERPLLIVPETRPTFVAEYVYWLRRRSMEHLYHSRGLDLYFLPLRGLGQRRASAVWLEATVDSAMMHDRLLPVNAALCRALEALYSATILDEFLLSAFRTEQARLGSGRVEEAFKSLWWADELAFFREGQFRRGFLRDDNAMRETGPSALTHALKRQSQQDSFLVATPVDGSPELTRVVLYLRRLSAVVPSTSPEVIDAICRLVGFDEVHFVCPFFDTEDFATSRWDEQLAERIGRMAESLRAAAKGERTAAYESIGHTLKTAVQLTGWRGWHQSLRELARSHEDQADSLVLNGAANALALFSLAEGLGGLVRLIGILDNDEKLRALDKQGWVDPTLLTAWQEGDTDAILKAYFATVQEVARIVCLGVGWPTLQLRCCQSPGDASEYNWTYDAAAEAHEVLNVNTLSTPPFRAGSDGVVAVLPALLEPMRNAVTAMGQSRKRGLSTTTALRVELEADLPGSVIVRVGNTLPNGEKAPPGMPPGLRTTAALLGLARVASFREPRVESTGTRERVFWIDVDLHPVDLASRILGRDTHRSEE